MKNFSLHYLLALLFIPAFFSLQNCTRTTTENNDISYEVSITPVSRVNAPALQSFAHAKKGSDWLLFAGRTNSRDSLIGGLHNINGNYADSSFIPPSFNGNLFVYNVDSDQVWSMPFGNALNLISENCANCEVITDNTRGLFISTNPLVTQKGDYLYLTGGYGPDPATSESYMTYNLVMKMHVPSMINLIKKNYLEVDWKNLLRAGSNDLLRSTGGELFVINNTLYLAGGHNFGITATGGQQYVSAVYPFTLSNDEAYGLTVNMGNAISDKSNPTDSAEANNSIFRRRDAPIVPAVYKHDGALVQGITFYTGVFKPGSPPQAWNDAIYVHPGLKNAKNKFYSPDSSYNQSNHNVYSTAHFEAYDSDSDILHTFLLGGIGTGKVHGADTLSGFTNNGVHITMDINVSDPVDLQSQYTLMENVFPSDTLYGAESILFLNKSDLTFTTAGGDETEVIDLTASFGDIQNGSIDIGYIYGGIEAYQANPQTYGKGKSSASNKIWKVTLRKNSN